MDGTETKRQIVHLSGAFSLVPLLYLGKMITGVGAVAIALGILTLSWWVKKKHEIRERFPIRLRKVEDVEDRTHELLNGLEREEVLDKMPYYGAFCFFTAIGLSVLVLPVKWALLAVLILSVSDALATMVGVHVGKFPLFHNQNKSLEGSLTFFASAFVISLLFLSPVVALYLAIFTALVESVPRLNDNFSIPLAVGLFFLLL